jgi:hypothetical protein
VKAVVVNNLLLERIVMLAQSIVDAWHKEVSVVWCGVFNLCMPVRSPGLCASIKPAPVPLSFASLARELSMNRVAMNETPTFLNDGEYSPTNFHHDFRLACLQRSIAIAKVQLSGNL